MIEQDLADWQTAIQPAGTAFFLDVDGTLLGFKDRPEDVVADPDLLDLVQRLRRVADGAVAFVSGRTLIDLDRIMAPLVLPAGGVHGAELRFADGRREAFEGAALTEVRTKTERFVAAHPGIRFEDKGGTTFALHYRMAPEWADAVALFLEEAVAGHDLMVQHGKMVAEVKPHGCHKGLAIEALMQTVPFSGRAPLFMGDDLTDEYGFAAVNKLDGLSIKIGEDGKSIAHHRLVDTTAVRHFLDVICRSGEGRQYK